MRHDLLADPLLTMRDSAGAEQAVSLPALLAALGRGDVESLPRVQRHQVDAIHMFLCYLAGNVLVRANQSNVVQEHGFWRDQLRRLAGSDDHAPWCLIVEDPERPAFMQPPVASVNQCKGFRVKAETPDELDVLQTAKNHDVKGARMLRSVAEDWIFALISLQTMSGFLGAGNYGVARMNSGFGSRPCVGVVSGLRLSDRWLLDTQRLLAIRPNLLTPEWPYRDSGLSLLWCMPWDGARPIPLDDLDPFFLEVSRLVRLMDSEARIRALGQSSKEGRVASKEQKGNVGDPWIPITRRTGGALTVPAAGFTPRLLRDLLLDNEKYIPAPMQELEPGDESVWVRASVIVRGNGTTDGYHEAMIPVSQRVRFALASGPKREWLSRISEWGLDRAGAVQSRALRPALFSLLEGGPDGWPDTGKREVGEWVDRSLGRYGGLWGDAFFPWLWRTLETDEAEAKRDWMDCLHGMARETLEQAMDRVPERAGRRYRGRVRADGLFQGMWNRHLRIEEA